MCLPPKNKILLLVSVVLGFLFLEGALRLTLDRSDLYRGLRAYPDLNRRYYESFFLKNTLRPSAKDGPFDAFLGWDIGPGNRVRGKRVYELKTPDGFRRVVAIGDSFTYGGDVKNDESYPAFLEKSFPNIEVLNMGVPGYGIGQAYLKYRRFGRRYKPDLVILGIHPGDYERTSLSFFSYSKPRIKRDKKGAFKIFNQPVPSPIDELSRISREADGQSFAWTMLKNSFRVLKTKLFGYGNYLSETNDVIRHILTTLKRQTQSDGGRLLIVQLPLGDRFIMKKPWAAIQDSELKKIYADVKVRFLDVRNELLADYSGAEIVKRFYVRDRSGTIRHFNPAGNKKVAGLISLITWPFNTKKH